MCIAVRVHGGLLFCSQRECQYNLFSFTFWLVTSMYIFISVIVYVIVYRSFVIRNQNLIRKSYFSQNLFFFYSNFQVLKFITNDEKAKSTFKMSKIING